MSETPPKTRLEVVASALEFPWTVGLPVDPSNPENCSLQTEDAIHPKTEVDDDCEFVCEIPGQWPTPFPSKNDVEAVGEVKAASRISEDSWNFHRTSDSCQSLASTSAVKQG